MTDTSTGVSNVVLVHGAFADGSGWRGVHDRLTAPLPGLRAFARFAREGALRPGPEGLAGIPVLDPAGPRNQASRLLDDAAERIAAQHPDVPVTAELVAGMPREVLEEASAGADLLVVGHRGRGGIASACLGSVGLHCVLHATCPVVVVRKAPVPAEQARVAAASGGVRS